MYKIVLRNEDTKILKDRQRTYNVTLRRVSESIVAMEKQYALHILNVCL